ncbi:ECF transporter S component [Lactococcus fujiensis]|uniref:Riboflavin transporter n=1 Tax=Lactococcus fujiensis JCM 16395 TaxID=1291764 RepID=A0A2A5RQD0_9LACT|nr:ECF transporter S component [Lactococcus fujiensis]PCS01589.1 hypothetical protein RT41_GL000353 [Lactococcus fujiensis JCM 16395]
MSHSRHLTGTRRLTLIAMLSAISTILAFPVFQFVLIPSVNFMKVELTILPILIGVFVLGLADGFIILIIRSILWLILFNQGPSTIIGMPMNMIALGIFMVMMWLFLHKSYSIKGLIWGSVSAIIATVLIEMLMNIIYAIPVYAKFAGFNIATMFPGGIKAYLLGGVLPFNTLENLIFAVLFAIIFTVLRRNKVVTFYNA